MKCIIDKDRVCPNFNVKEEAVQDCHDNYQMHLNCYSQHLNNVIFKLAIMLRNKR